MQLGSALAALTLAGGAHAAPSPALDFRGRYEFSFAGMTFGRMGIEARQQPDGYDITCDVTTSGLIRLFVRHSSHTAAHGKGTNFSYPSIHYVTDYQTRGKARHVELVYRGGILAEEKLDPPETHATRPEVPAELKNVSTDPLSLTFRMREGVMSAPQSGQFMLRVFDGRRLTRVDFTLGARGALNYQGKNLPVVEVTAIRTLEAGHTKDELADRDPKEKPARIFFSDDGRFIPLRAEASTWLGKVSATLVKECPAGESCLLGNKN